MGYTKAAVKGVSWLGAFRVITRISSFIRTAILARLLLPEQFGIFGIASLTLAFLEVFTETGINVFLIQLEKQLKAYLNTAWVISIVRGFVISLIIAALSPMLSKFFNTPEALRLLLLISLVPLIKGFINPAIVSFQKNLQFHKEFWLRTSVFLIDSLIAIIVVFLTQSSVGLVWGLIAGATTEVLLSFLLLALKPKFVLRRDRLKEIVRAGKWVTASGIFEYLSRQGADMVIAKILNPYSLGLYQMAFRVSTLPVSEISDVANKVTFPVFVKIAGSKSRLAKAFTKSLVAVSAVSLPLSLALIFFPRPLIRIFLGKNWLQASNILQILAAYGAVRAISGAAGAVFLALKRQDIVTRVTLTRFLSLAITIIPLVKFWGPTGAAFAVLISAILATPVITYYLYCLILKPISHV